MFKLKKLICLIIAAAALTVPVSALTESVTVKVNGDTLYSDQPLLIDNTTYVPVKEFRSAVGDSQAEAAFIYDSYIECAGRYIYSDAKCFSINGEQYAPVRSLCRLYGAAVQWNQSESTVSVNAPNAAIVSGDSFYDADELYWMSRIIASESGGEPLEGKLAVGSVVMNRVESEDFPDTIYGVIFDNEYSVQFTPTSNGRIYNTPDSESVMAAKMTLDGYRVSDDILYFIYQAIATNFWTVYNRGYEFTIGCHDFYS